MGFRAVMVWIYGGFFVNGSSSYERYGPDFILNDDVIVVTFNYRVGVFGFLSTGDRYLPGNYALQDQVLALQWVQQNIEAFGGDKSKVTIFSESAGAVCASYLTQVPEARGLFQAAILSSGNSLTPFAVTRNPKSKAKEIASLLGISTLSSKSMADGLRNATTAQLAKAQFKIVLSAVIFGNPLNNLPFAPTFEPFGVPVPTVRQFSHARFRLGEFNRIPYLIGINSEEALLFGKVIKLFPAYLLKYILDSQNLVPDSLNIRNPLVKTEVGELIKFYYLINELELSELPLIKLFSDDAFNRPTMELGLLLSKFTPVYFYEFSYKGPLGSGYNDQTGVGHGADLYYLWNRESPGTPTKSDLLTRKRLIRLWTNFAKTGNPTPVKDPLLQNVEWPVLNYKDQSSITYLNINNSLTPMLNLKWNEFLFWKQIFRSYGIPPYSTY